MTRNIASMDEPTYAKWYNSKGEVVYLTRTEYQLCIALSYASHVATSSLGKDKYFTYVAPLNGGGVVGVTGNF